MKKITIPESVIVKKAQELFLKKGYRVALEVPFLERSIDLVYMDKAHNLIAIEFKWSNWKRALIQASTHVYGASKVYICIPKPERLSEQLEDEIEDTLIGVLFFTFDEGTKKIEIETHKPAKKLENQWAPGRKWLREAFKQREKGETKCCIA